MRRRRIDMPMLAWVASVSAKDGTWPSWQAPRLRGEYLSSATSRTTLPFRGSPPGGFGGVDVSSYCPANHVGNSCDTDFDCTETTAMARNPSRSSLWHAWVSALIILSSVHLRQFNGARDLMPFALGDRRPQTCSQVLDCQSHSHRHVG